MNKSLFFYIGIFKTRNNFSNLCFRKIKQRFRLYYLPSGYDLVPGDNILTSGIGGIFPKGIAIGTVTEVSRANEDTEDRNAIIQPAVDFLRLEEVMIVNMEEQEEE